MADGVWTFKRDGGSVSLERRLADDEIVLAVRHQEDLRLFAFPDLHALIRFQEDMETFLLRTGWTLASFSPERRQLADRRSFPRVTNDRRRWWTDGVPD